VAEKTIDLKSTAGMRRIANAKETIEIKLAMTSHGKALSGNISLIATFSS